ncbi:hypothetical protein GCM10010531_44770 [Blastococcus jejuensis]|uniref:Uncharacterized protein n=1 Tax=Blastococcus jejuensis TaxID=351224 RepID=A0ABP6PSC4_9ACTN
MTLEPSTSRTPQRSGLTLAAVLLALLLVAGGLAGLGWQELGLIVLAVLLLTWPALAFYAWARSRGDL